MTRSFGLPSTIERRQSTLLTIDGAGAGVDQLALTPAIVQALSSNLPSLAKRCLNGNADFVDLNGIDLWLEAPIYDGEGYWRWNEESRALEFFQD